MPELIEVELRERMLRDRCVGMKIDQVEVREPHALHGIDSEELQHKLANSRLVDVRHKGQNLVMTTDRGNTLLLTMRTDADVEIQESPAPEHAAAARVILHFDDGHTLDLVMPTMRDRFFFFPTTDLDRLPPLRDLGPEATEISFEAFRDRMRAHQVLSVNAFLTGPQYLSGLSQADADEIGFQARVKPDRQISSLLKSDVEALYDAMQNTLTRLREVEGNVADLERFGFLMPRRGTDKGCPRCGSGLEVQVLDGERSYFCPKEQEPVPWDPKRMCFW